MFTTELAHNGPFVNSAVVPKDNNMAAKMLQKIAQKPAHFFMLDVFHVQGVVKAEAFALRTDRNTGDYRDAIMLLMVADNRSLPARCPRSAHGRDQQKAGLVGEHQIGAQPRSVFFTCGHFVRFHCSIALSSCCQGRFFGFWQLHRRPIMMRPMWSRWYRTPKVRSITSAMRAVVHNSVWYPLSTAPFRRILTKRRFCASVSRAGRPGAGRAESPPSPSLSRASRHRITALAWHLTFRPTSRNDIPESSNFMALRRRFSSDCGEPIGRIGPPPTKMTRTYAPGGTESRGMLH
jgi:hypothetical protein